MFVAGELIKELLLGEFLTILLFGAEILRDGELRHDGTGVYIVYLHLIDNLLRVL